MLIVWYRTGTLWTQSDVDSNVIHGPFLMKFGRTVELTMCILLCSINLLSFSYEQFLAFTILVVTCIAVIYVQSTECLVSELDYT